jgi:hypothetical protein
MADVARVKTGEAILEALAELAGETRQTLRSWWTPGEG